MSTTKSAGQFVNYDYVVYERQNAHKCFHDYSKPAMSILIIVFICVAPCRDVLCTIYPPKRKKWINLSVKLKGLGGGGFSGAFVEMNPPEKLPTVM